MADPLLIAKSGRDVFLLPQMANRHGLIAGATGTGKTVSLQVIAEALSAIGVPSVVADVKGDFAGVSQPGTAKPRIAERLQQLAITDHQFRGSPVAFWDVFGELGHPLRATVSEMGPLLLGRVLNLNDTQSGVLSIAFRIADDDGLLLLDLKDLRAIVQYVGENTASIKTEYGNVSTASIGAIQRGLLTLEDQGGESLFGEPALDLGDFLQTGADGRGVINIIAAERLIQAPKTYATFLLWLLSELYETMPEAGDLDQPKLVFFFDEAHLLFEDAPDALVEKIEQVVRLIRSKGVGVYFITQNPLDVPDKVLGQLGNRVQHALRAFTPRDERAVMSAAETFRPNPPLDVRQAITELGVGEALVSTLDDDGVPCPVERAFIVPPRGQIGPIAPEQRQAILKSSLVAGHYEQALDRESAYELLKTKAEQAEAAADEADRAEAAERDATAAERRRAPAAPKRRSTGRKRESIAEATAKSTARAVGSQLGRSITRGILGGLFGSRRR